MKVDENGLNWMEADESGWKQGYEKTSPARKNITMAAFHADGDDDHILHISQLSFQ